MFELQLHFAMINGLSCKFIVGLSLVVCEIQISIKKQNEISNTIGCNIVNSDYRSCYSSRVSL
jgi:hypothetical protein